MGARNARGLLGAAVLLVAAARAGEVPPPDLLDNLAFFEALDLIEGSGGAAPADPGADPAKTPAPSRPTKAKGERT